MNFRYVNRAAQCTAVLLCIFCAAADLHGEGETSAFIHKSSTRHVIFHDPAAPASVKKAARELQTYIKKASNTKIAITTTPPRKGQPFISLGQNRLYQTAGFADDDLKHDGYIIAIKDGNVYIRGLDTETILKPGRLLFSKGTLFGTYTFIEETLGVRWFMPGENGEYIPSTNTIPLTEGITLHNPDFQWRRIPYLYRDRSHQAEVTQWLLRNKINEKAYRNALSHGHIWHHVFTPDLFEQHPEYFAEQGGRRIAPTGHSFKICTTNPGAVQVMASRIQRYFNNNPHAMSYSMSPTDNPNWCQCNACTALDEQENQSRGRLTRRILTFYNAVAKIVAETHPDKYCGGYVYSEYLYPPKDSSITVEPNVFLVIASDLTYGYSFFRPEVRQSWHTILQGWKSLTENIAYYDLPIHSRSTYGAPLAPGIQNLSYMFPALKKYDIQGLYIYGHPEWGHAALYNYLLARLMWNADLDIDRHLDDFFSKCYGSGGSYIRTMYERIDTEMESYYLSRRGRNARYRMTPDILRNVYVPLASQIERLYFQALAATPEGSQRQRISMLGDNLFALDHFMKTLGVLPASAEARFSLSTEKFAAFREKHQGALHAPFGGKPQPPARPVVNGITAFAYTEPLHNRERPRRFNVRGTAHFVMQAQRAEPVEIRFTNVRMRLDAIRYIVQTCSGEALSTGTLFGDGTIRFDATAGTLYHLLIDTSSTSYNIEFSDIPHAVNTTPTHVSAARRMLHLQKQVTPLYFHIGKDVESFSVFLRSDSRPGTLRGGETAAADLYDPDDNRTATLSTVAAATDHATIEEPAQGFWKLRVKRALRGFFDDVYVRIEGEGVSGFASLDPDGLLIITIQQ